LGLRSDGANPKGLAERRDFDKVGDLLSLDEIPAGLSCFVDLEGMFSLGLFARDLRIFFDFGLATCSLIGEPELEVDSLLPGIAVFFRMRLPVGLLCPKHSIVEEAAAEFSSSGNVSTL